MGFLRMLGLTPARPAPIRMLLSYHEMALEGWYDWWEFTTPDGWRTRVYAEFVNGSAHVARVERRRLLPTSPSPKAGGEG